MKRSSYIILLIILIVIYAIYFTENSYLKNILKTFIPNNESYNNEKLPMKHPNFIYNQIDALKHKFYQPGRDFTGYFTKTM